MAYTAQRHRNSVTRTAGGLYHQYRARMTDRSWNGPHDPGVRIERAEAFDGFVVIECGKVVVVALSHVEAEAMIDRIKADLSQTCDTQEERQCAQQ